MRYAAYSWPNWAAREASSGRTTSQWKATSVGNSTANGHHDATTRLAPTIHPTKARYAGLRLLANGPPVTSALPSRQATFVVPAASITDVAQYISPIDTKTRTKPTGRTTASPGMGHGHTRLATSATANGTSNTSDGGRRRGADWLTDATIASLAGEGADRSTRDLAAPTTVPALVQVTAARATGDRRRSLAADHQSPCEGRRVSLPPITEDHRARRFADGYDRVFAEVERTFLGPIRSRLVGQLTGRVVEIGAGTGANIRHYASADRVELVEPFPRMREQLHQRLGAREGGIPMRVVDGRAEELPFADGSVDAVVSTLVLCSVVDVQRTLAEVSRVLAPGGVFAYLEHSRGRGLKRIVQTAITPLTIRYAAGCHHDRDLAAAIAGMGAAHVEPVHVPAPLGIRMLPEWPLIAGRATVPGPISLSEAADR